MCFLSTTEEGGEGGGGEGETVSKPEWNAEENIYSIYHKSPWAPHVSYFPFPYPD